ncbi:endonuclease domain-containing protein [Pelagibius sp.]|uniref:endonuclease domain-containing protein n=1 Tax=Pelagibius sp. TaxID=1931238 RepID=UPI003B500329
MASKNARALRRQMTDAERTLWAALRRRQIDGLRFRRQVPLGRFIVDFACYDARLVIELDGGQHAGRQQEDTVRMQWLEARGFRVLRFWNSEIGENLEAVLEAIRDAAGSDRDAARRERGSPHG